MEYIKNEGMSYRHTLISRLFQIIVYPSLT